MTAQAFWLVNHSWDSFRRTHEYCGFVSPSEQQKIMVGDGIVYFGQGLIFGVFEAVALVENEFKGWAKPYVFQIKLKPIEIVEGGLIAKQLQDKLQVQKVSGGSPNLSPLTESEFAQVKKAVENKQKRLELF